MPLIGMKSGNTAASDLGSVSGAYSAGIHVLAVTSYEFCTTIVGEAGRVGKWLIFFRTQICVISSP
jgi:hypothetical protein